MLSGYFATAHAEKAMRKSKFAEREIALYTLKKYLRFLPYCAIGCIIKYTGTFFFNHDFSVISSVQFWSKAPFELFLLRDTGITTEELLGPYWYLSSFLIVLPIFLFLIVCFERIFKYYLVWLLPLFIYGYMIQTFGTIVETTWWITNLRAFAGLLLGASLYYLSSFLQKFSFSMAFRYILSIFEIGLFVFVLTSTMVESWSWSPMDIFFISLLYLSLVLSFSSATCTAHFHNRIFDYLGKLSFIIYCLHPAVIMVFYHYLQPGLLKSVSSPQRQSVTVSILTIFLSVITLPFVEKILPHLIQGIKRHCFVTPKTNS